MEQPGALPLWALNGRPSASADAAHREELARLRALSPMERIRRALLLGLETRRLHTAAEAARERR